MKDVRRLLGMRIRQARERMGLSQQQLAERAQLGYHQTVSQIERGLRDVAAWELAGIARALRVELRDLLRYDADSAPAPVVVWRDPPTEGRAEAEASFLQACRRYALLEELCDARPNTPLPARQDNPAQLNRAGAEAMAADVSRMMDLGSRPALSLTRVLEESYGVKLWYAHLSNGGSAASTYGPFGPAILTNASEARWRRNFSVAHELFHLLFWNEGAKSASAGGDDPHVETLANTFASSLLLPAEAVTVAFWARARGGVPHGSDIVEIARAFDVSTDALIVRLVRLGLLTKKQGERLRNDETFRFIDKASMRGRWTTPAMPPERFVRLAFLAFTAGKLSRMTLADWLGCSLPDLPGVLEEYGFTSEDKDECTTVAQDRFDGGSGQG